MTSTLTSDDPQLVDYPSGVPAEVTSHSDPAPVLAPVAHRGIWRTAKSIISMIAGTILAIVAVLALFVAVGTRLSSNGQLGLLGHPVMSVLSGSMAPTINTGDLVVDNKLTAVQAANLHVGQIISFRGSANSRQIFTHRIAAVETLPGGGAGYITKGDANASQDGPLVASTSVVGLYRTKVPDGGFILNALHKPLALGLILASPVLWLLSEPLWKWARQEEVPASDGALEGGERRS